MTPQDLEGEVVLEVKGGPAGIEVTFESGHRLVAIGEWRIEEAKQEAEAE